MNTDKELVELAGKAHGGFQRRQYVEEFIHDECGYLSAGIYLEAGSNSFTWNPLNNSSDALDLAVRLNIFVQTYSFGGPPPSENSVRETRRAITMAAAELGKVKCQDCNDTGDMSLGPTDYFGKCTCRAADAPSEPSELAQLSDAKIIEWAEGYLFSQKGFPHKLCFSRTSFINAVRTILSHSPAHRAADALDSQPTARPTDDDLWDATLRDRDAYHEWADKLANAIAMHFGVDIGEHSNHNLPWAEALEAIELASSQPSVAAQQGSIGKDERFHDLIIELDLASKSAHTPAGATRQQYAINELIKLIDSRDSASQVANAIQWRPLGHDEWRDLDLKGQESLAGTMALRRKPAPQQEGSEAGNG